MNNKKDLRIINILKEYSVTPEAYAKLWLCSIIIGIIATIGVIVYQEKSEAHYLESDVNHAHVCTITDPLNIRLAPDVYSKELGKVKQGKVIQIKALYTDWETNESWYKIKATSSTNNISGYVSSKYICF